MKGRIKLSTRITADEYYINMAQAASMGSTCNRARVGAVIVKDNIILGTGYNGSLSGHEHCNEDNCKPDSNCIRTIHAEVNALERAIRVGFYEKLKGATIYSTHRPCYSCVKTLAAFGIMHIVYDKLYEDPRAEEYFKMSNMVVYPVNEG